MISRGSRRRQQTMTSTSSSRLNNGKQHLRRSPGEQNGGFRRSEGPDDQRTTLSASPRSPPPPFITRLVLSEVNGWSSCGRTSRANTFILTCGHTFLGSDGVFRAARHLREFRRCFSSLLHEVFWYLMDKTTGTHIRDELCFFYS